MPFLTINSNTPLVEGDPLISFRVRGQEVAALMPTGAIQLQGIEFPDDSYIQSAANTSISSSVDGGLFSPLRIYNANHPS